MTDKATPLGDSAAQGGGSIPGTDGAAAFHLIRTSSAPVLVAVPHAGRAYPDALLAAMRHGPEARIRLEDRLVDRVAEAVASTTGAALIVAQAPRAMIDLNRGPEDIDWDMVAGGAPDRRSGLAIGRRARSGLGLVPRRLPGLGELWRKPLAPDMLEARLAGIHRPYHAALSRTLESLRDAWGMAVLIDLHSMPPLGPKRGAEAAPDFVIGDRFGSACDAALSRAAFDHFAAAGRSTAHNRPYAGGYGLDRHAAPGRGIHALQVEICRSTYLDSALEEPGPGLASVVRVLSGLVQRLAQELATRRDVAQAAE